MRVKAKGIDAGFERVQQGLRDRVRIERIGHQQSGFRIGRNKGWHGLDDFQQALMGQHEAISRNNFS